MEMAAHQDTLPMGRVWRERDAERQVAKQRSQQDKERAYADAAGVSASDRDRAGRSALAKLFPSSGSSSASASASASSPAMGQNNSSSSLRKSSSSAGDPMEYSRRSEPALSKSEVALDGHEDLDLRRSMPSSGRASSDISWALQSVRQSEAHSNRLSSSAVSNSSSVSSSSSTSAFGIAMRSPVSVYDVYEADSPTKVTNRTATLSRPLQRAQSADVVPKPEAMGDMSQLRQQVTLLMRSLEEEKKRRAMEQKLMQQKILELQGLIRHNMPEKKRELERSLQTTRAQQTQTPPYPRDASATISSIGSSTASSSASFTSVAAQAAAACTLPARVRAIRTTKQPQTSHGRGPYKTLKILNEQRTEQRAEPMDVSGCTDDERDFDDEEGQELGVDDDLDDLDNQSDAKDAMARAVDAQVRQRMTHLRARMRSMVEKAQQEAHRLKHQLEEERKSYERRERQLRMDASMRASSLEERHSFSKKKMLAKQSLLSTQVAMLTDEKQKLQQELQRKDQRIQQLEMALGGRRIVMESSSAISSSSASTASSSSSMVARQTRC